MAGREWNCGSSSRRLDWTGLRRQRVIMTSLFAIIRLIMGRLCVSVCEWVFVKNGWDGMQLRLLVHCAKLLLFGRSRPQSSITPEFNCCSSCSSSYKTMAASEAFWPGHYFTIFPWFMIYGQTFKVRANEWLCVYKFVWLGIRIYIVNSIRIELLGLRLSTIYGYRSTATTHGMKGWVEWEEPFGDGNQMMLMLWSKDDIALVHKLNLHSSRDGEEKAMFGWPQIKCLWDFIFAKISTFPFAVHWNYSRRGRKRKRRMCSDTPRRTCVLFSYSYQVPMYDGCTTSFLASSRSTKELRKSVSTARTLCPQFQGSESLRM